MRASATDTLARFTDRDDIGDWALANVKWAVAEGLITGRTDTAIVPGGTATRAEVATIIMRFLEGIAK